ncbi:MAG: hypothetical protein K2M98_04470 [Muribaculum sp.]|nr:hypothetical protein [Muribaculum sp.]
MTVFRVSFIVGMMILLFSSCGTREEKGPELSSRTTSSLNRLDTELVRRDVYRRQRRASIDSLLTSLASHGQTPQRRLEQTWELANLYDGFLSDSALLYYTRGEELAHAFGNPYWRTRFRIHKLRIMPLSTVVHQAVSEFNEILEDSIPESLAIETYDAGRQLYEYVASYYDSDPATRAYWSDLSISMMERMLEIPSTENSRKELIRSEYLYVTGEYARSVALLDSLLKELPKNTNMAARAFFIMSRNAAATHRYDDRIYWLTQSAQSDIASATLEVTALTELGIVLYNHGDIKRAYQYLTVSMANAVECHAVLRMLETSRVVPMINLAHQNAQKTYQRNYLWGICILCAVITGILIILSRLLHELKRTKILKVRIERANLAKETYLSQFMSLATGYMNKLDEFCQIAERKITNGKVEELYNLARSRRLIEDQTRDFYATFDNAFINLYPTFVEDINKLLRPDAQIEYVPGEPFNTDLRILAFMRIGIEDSSMIANALNYSINTIYAYRNRLKKRAIDRDNFEHQIMNIGRGNESYTKE